MTNIHEESDHNRMSRLLETVKQTIETARLKTQRQIQIKCNNYDKTFGKVDELKTHEEKHHTIEISSDTSNIEIETSQEEVSDQDKSKDQTEDEEPECDDEFHLRIVQQTK